MHDFIHHPDDKIIIEGDIFEMDFWMIVEPQYALPQGYIGRLFTAGQVHQLVAEGNSRHDPADKNDPIFAEYVARKAEYVEAYAAQQNGSYIENIEGDIVISGPPTLSVNKSQIENDGVDSITITCQLDDNTLEDEIRWSVTAPDGTVVTAAQNAVNGVDTWELTTSHEGVHQVQVETDEFGSAGISFEGV